MYHVYMDNYFSSISLFKYLYKNDIGVCSTVCTNLISFSKELKASKEMSLDWNMLLEKIDNRPVTMLTTIHEISDDDWKVTCNQRRPHETSMNANIVHQIFEDSSQKELAIL
ncbi:10542_t:CDS:2 [Cetraspora pellucida]|uniref:10542_t:CDS:1 n=1 Tax=Cetraspora pellucida TaxID=1433469 RepID=A0A9N9N5W6_9GLOM|nr:10542_t:CDS:2 [Cetraspora pellucida]